MDHLSKPHSLIIGLSGPSSSGKTTLARLLRDIFNTTIHLSTNSTITTSLIIIHEDDFYKTDIDIPYRTITSSSSNHGVRSLQDWDCVESLDLPLLSETLNHVKTHGELPSGFASKEDQNSVGESGVSKTIISELKEGVEKFLKARFGTEGKNDENVELRICILDGFLLFPPPGSYLETNGKRLGETTSVEQLAELFTILEPVMDLKLFLPSTLNLTVKRRAARTGYVTLEGFWEDPPGYVEDVVWPNYARDHGWMFASKQDVDAGHVDHEAADRQSILVGPGSGDKGMAEVLQWGIFQLKIAIEKINDY